MRYIVRHIKKGNRSVLLSYDKQHMFDDILMLFYDGTDLITERRVSFENLKRARHPELVSFVHEIEQDQQELKEFIAEFLSVYPSEVEEAPKVEIPVKRKKWKWFPW